MQSVFFAQANDKMARIVCKLFGLLVAGQIMFLQTTTF
ncbi:hypothetical protein JCM19239_4640 [Vibrio variabilis]|uniref:Threonine efflux protein n=1 Tax=Vibrio variabilis TaxID=990271 RepID=A0ABQ0J818_9VIBR|nr:hypothetical protein JCM19239_4640 [Vibrio variabilis]